MKILQVGDICGIPQILAAEQRRRGHEADSIRFSDGPYTISWRVRKFLKLAEHIPAYEEIHFHYSTALPFAIDLLLWGLLGKRIIMHFHGSDIRGKRLNPIIKYCASKIYVSTPDLLKWGTRSNLAATAL